MNILFFLKPKVDLAYIYDDSTMRQALEKMKHYGYAAIPVINRDGEYVGTLSEGDLLWAILNHKAYDNHAREALCVRDILKGRQNKPVNFPSPAQPGDLVHVELLAATSTSLRGRALA